eukprot:CAMPEP_0198254256 /NCGR_PEP_ID=MMETSP1447-20131203/4584_1 /TAXON_ID=420782 /ORGANISM="Chaetoceros dichaeta, Strain CCMP1751" /LENGTH=173 /DNA_ID=CAMNT_0043940231 /DNA_START=678 /DNA_END=1199 /DNA_ORIENTATION=+
MERTLSISHSFSDDTSPSLPSTNELQSQENIIVSGAGLITVNGVYNYDGIFDTAAKYSKRGMWKNREVTFSLFRCLLSDNTKRWYISIVPSDIQPGTNKDTDFYLATSTGDQSELPDSVMWMTAKEGKEPAPTATLSGARYGTQGQAAARWEPLISITRSKPSHVARSRYYAP